MSGTPISNHEEQAIREAMERNGYMARAAARELGLSNSSMHRRLRKFGIATKGVAGRRPEALAGRAARAIGTGGRLTGAGILGAFDPVRKVMECIDALPPDEFRRDVDVLADTGITRTAWDKARKHERVRACQVKLPDGSSVWGKAPDADLLRRKLLEV